MFDNLSNRLSGTLKRLRGQARLTDENVQETLREVRMALLEADVALTVVRDFTARVKERAVGQDVLKSLTPGQALIKVVNEELIAVMGAANEELDLSVQPPAIVLMAGLQGAGKTTTVAKLACWLKERADKSVMVASCDVYRPAAIQQLGKLASEVEAEFFPSDSEQDPVHIARSACDQARGRFMDVLILDTAGRLHIDDSMMAEIKEIHAAVDPVETLFVVDSMTGQDAAVSAQAFDQALPLTGVILTKADGDARGGAALSVRQITGKPIKFLGVGEKTTALEAFHPERIASRILGMGDVVGLVEEAQRKVDSDAATKLARKLKKGKGFTLEDLRGQLTQMLDMGGMAGLLDKMPGGMAAGLSNEANDKEVRRWLAIIDSMTPGERRTPALVKGSRKRRIAAGSGTQIQDVNRLLKQHNQMSKMMKKFAKGGMGKLMRSMRGRMPPGVPF
ncbi:MAG: signal recognition particle protein [Gammaproteobacteria bacterium]